MRQRSRAQRAAYARRQADIRRQGERDYLASLELSAAQRDQGEVNVLDLALVARAQLRHPGVRWWWGETRRQDRRGAWCYLCDTFITAGTIRRPLTRTAQAAILAHRDQAHAGLAATMGSASSATQAEADQSEGSNTP